MPNQPELRDIQAWLHTFVVEPGNATAALKAAEAKAGFAAGSAEELVLPSPTLTPQERIQIYRGMYLLRMQEALEIDFPAVRWHVGEDKFEELVAEYVHSHPSRSYTLDHLGRHFPKFLRVHQGEGVAELAALEWSLCMVAIAHDSPTVAMVDLGEVPEEKFLDLSFQPIPALELHSFRYNANELYKLWGDDSDPVAFEEKPCRIVCWRHELRVWRLELGEPAFYFLTLLCGGTSLGESIDLTIEHHEESEEQLFGWFQEWVAEGFFRGFTLP